MSMDTTINLNNAKIGDIFQTKDGRLAMLIGVSNSPTLTPYNYLMIEIESPFAFTVNEEGKWLSPDSGSNIVKQIK